MPTSPSRTPSKSQSWDIKSKYFSLCPMSFEGPQRLSGRRTWRVAMKYEKLGTSLTKLNDKSICVFTKQKATWLPYIKRQVDKQEVRHKFCGLPKGTDPKKGAKTLHGTGSFSTFPWTSWGLIPSNENEKRWASIRPVTKSPPLHCHESTSLAKWPEMAGIISSTSSLWQFPLVCGLNKRIPKINSLAGSKEMFHEISEVFRFSALLSIGNFKQFLENHGKNTVFSGFSFASITTLPSPWPHFPQPSGKITRSVPRTPRRMCTAAIWSWSKQSGESFCQVTFCH